MILRSDRRQQRFLALCRVHQRQSELAEHRHFAPPRRSRAVAGARRPAGRHRVLRHRPAADRQGTLRAGARAAAPRATAPARRRHCATPGAMTHFPADLEDAGARVFAGLITPADDTARMDARLYAEDDDAGLRAAHHLDATALADRQGARGRHQPGGQRQGAARCRAGERTPRPRLHVQPHPMAAARRQDRRGRRVADRGAARCRPSSAMPINGGSSGGSWRASCSTSATPRRPIEVASERAAARPRRIIASSSNSPPAGSRFAFCTSRPPRSPHFAKIADGVSNPITLARSCYWQGRAAEAMGQQAGGAQPFTRRRRAIRPPITASSPGRGSASTKLRSRTLPEPPAEQRTLEIARALEMLYAVDERDLVAVDRGRSRRQGDRYRRAGGARRDRGAAQRCARDAADRQGRARPRLSVRTLRVSRFRRAGLPADRPAGRAVRRLFDRPPGKRLQSPGRLQRQCDRPDAGHAGGRPRHRQEIQRHLRSAPAERRRGL